MTRPDRRDLGRVFNEVPELYDRVRPAYPDELFADLVAITGMKQIPMGALSSVPMTISRSRSDRTLQSSTSVQNLANAGRSWASITM